MNAQDILDMIGDAKGIYVWDAQKIREGGGREATRRLPVRRLWLTAAVIALVLLLAGCAIVYALSLGDMAFGTKVQEYYDGSSQERTLLSIQGVAGTPGYRATKEWYEWLEGYDTDGSVYHSEEAFSEDFGEEYYAYNLYSREMKDKLDEICEKYGLELLGKMYVDPDVEAGCKALQIPGIFRPGIQAEADWGNICYYANGSFDLEGYMRLDGENRHIVSFRCHRKNAFSDLYSSIGPEGTYEEWNYTTSYGVDTLMVLDHGGVRGNAAVFADRGEYVFLFSISEFEDMPLPDRAGLEAYAEAFDFSVQPQRVMPEALAKAEERLEEAGKEYEKQQEKMARSFSELGYENRIKFQLENAVNPELLGFAVLDLEGNGTEDLLVGENGYIRAVYTTVDGGTQHMMPMSILYTNAVNVGTDKGVGEVAPAQWSYIYLCENNGLAYVYDLKGDGVAYHFAAVRDGQLVWTERIVYDPVNHADAPWQMHDETHNSEPITEEMFYRIRDSHIRVPLEMQPIGEYPLTDDSPSGIGMPPETYESYDALIRRRTELEWEPGYLEKQLEDLDGDGQPELIWKEGDWIGVFTMQHGQVKQLLGGLDVQLCEGNLFAVTRTYLDGNKTCCYYKIQQGNAVLVDYLRYDAARNPENPWLRSSDASGQDASMVEISGEAFAAVREQYRPLAFRLEAVDGRK